MAPSSRLTAAVLAAAALSLLASSCASEPDLAPQPATTTAAEPEPTPTTTVPEPEQATTADAEPEPTPTTTVPEPEQATTAAEPEPTPTTTAAPQPEPTPTTTAPEPAPTTAVPAPEPAPTTAVPEPEPAPTTAVPEPTTAVPEPEPAPTTAVPEPEPEPTTTTVPEPEPEPTTTTVPEPEPEPTTTTVPEPELATTTTVPEPELATTTTVPEPEPTLDPVEAQIAAWEDLRDQVQEGAVWTEPDAARPPVHPETPEPSWDAGTWVPRTHPDDRPRRSENVQLWVDWCGDYSGCDWLLAQMTWAIDYLAADEVCVVEVYAERARQEASNYRESLPGEYGWHQCASVIDPRQPDGTLLSEQPGITIADRCRAVLPADIGLEYNEGGRRDARRDGLSCDEWGAWAESRRTGYETCDHSALLAKEWLEHYIGMPESYARLGC